MAKKRNVKSKRTKRRSKMPMQRVIPASRLVKMQFTSFNKLTPLQDQAATYVISANNINNPDLERKFENYPRGYGLMRQQYRRWVVVGSKIKVLATPTGVGPTAQTLLAVQRKDQNVVYTNYEQLVTARDIKRRYMPSSYSNVGGNLTMTYSIKRDHKVRNVAESSDNYGGVFKGKEPDDQMYYIIYVANPDTDLGGLLNVKLVIQVEYSVLCLEPLEYTIYDQVEVENPTKTTIATGPMDLETYLTNVYGNTASIHI